MDYSGVVLGDEREADISARHGTVAGLNAPPLDMLRNETPQKTIQTGLLLGCETLQPMGQSFGQLQDRVHRVDYLTIF